MSHTPGPWRAHGTAVYADAPQDIDHRRYRGFDRSDGDLGYLIAESIPHEPTRNLIAAAPDLLHVLEVIRDADRDCELDGLPRNLPPAIRAMADAAIQKAMGKP